jgi:hypothetical protein
LARVSRGSNLRLKLEPAAALGMRVERGPDERDATRALLDHRCTQRQRIGRLARLPCCQDVGIIAIERGKRLEKSLRHTGRDARRALGLG